MRARRLALIALIAATSPATVFADCSDPFGIAGNQIYNTTHEVMQYCNGDDWVNMGAPSGGVQDGDKGSITVSGSGTAWAIDNTAVTNAMLAGSIALSKLSTTGTASSSTFLRGDGAWTVIDTSISDGDKGDITVSSSGTAWTIDSGTVSLSKMANIATASLLGRNTAGTGAPEVLSASTVRSLLNLSNVENTALTNWTGSTSITTLGTITTGVWNAGAVTSSGLVTGTGFAPTATTATGNRLYLPATDTLGLAINGAGEVQLTGTALSPVTSDGNALGTSSLMWSDLFLASGAVIDFNNGDVTLTHSADTLTISGGNFAGSGSGLTSLNATNLTSGTVPTARLGTGTANSTTYLRGDGSWQTPSSTPSCSAAFTQMSAAGRTLGCIQTNEQGTANWYSATNTCFTTYGGRLPTFSELYLGVTNYSLTAETDDFEWVDERGDGEGTNADTATVTTTVATAFSSMSSGNYAYRCFIPNP